MWGVAYKISDEHVERVRSHLDHREKGGYEVHEVKFVPDPPSTEGPILLNVYVGTKNNPFFLGPAPLTDIAHQIFHSVGPSGKNIDYLMNLAQALRSLSPHAYDQHLFSLEEEVKVIAAKHTQNDEHDR